MPARMRRFLELGLDRIYTDDPALLLEVRREIGRQGDKIVARPAVPIIMVLKVKS